MGNMYGKGPRGVATKLHSKVVRLKGHCEDCGSDQNLQAAHIISRKYSLTRTALTNSFCLCASCHRRYTDHPVEFGEFVKNSWASEYYTANLKATQVPFRAPPDYWDDRVDFLKDILARVSEGEMTLEEAREYDELN